MTVEDRYKTITVDSESIFKEKSSKFITYLFPVKSEKEALERLQELKKRHYDATHHCWAYRLGFEGETFRANDDGEPSGTAGKPILGQLVSTGLTWVMAVVVRYFGGTKLGVSGLISAYRESTAQAIEEAQVVEKTRDGWYEVRFSYEVINSVMKINKEFSPRILEQNFDNMCSIILGIRASKEKQMIEKLEKIDSVQTEFLEYR